MRNENGKPAWQPSNVMAGWLKAGAGVKEFFLKRDDCRVKAKKIPERQLLPWGAKQGQPAE